MGEDTGRVVEIPRGRMVVEKGVRISLRDGGWLHANVFRPEEKKPAPVILAMGPYGKDAHFEDAYPEEWLELVGEHPDVAQGETSGRYLSWELADPERWVPDGYVVVAADVRGTGGSPGFFEPYSLREAWDLYQAIVWASEQSWSNGKVGLLGVSYMAVNQWQVAALQPPGLAAMIPWEGASDFYREIARNGGIYQNGFVQRWVRKQILPVLNGNEQTHLRDRESGLAVTGEPLPPWIWSRNVIDATLPHPLEDASYRIRTPDFSRIRTPLLSAANWGGAALHLRGNVEGFLAAGSDQKWLEFHTGWHYEHFYTAYGLDLQHRFFDHFLKGLDNGWDRTPPVLINVRTVDGPIARAEEAWPLARTHWTKLWLDATTERLATERPAEDGNIAYEAAGGAAHFDFGPLDKETEITGPLALRLAVSSSTSDMDVFVVLQAFDESGQELTFTGALEPAAPIAQGWLRASHRKLDPTRSLPYRPWHAHDEAQPLTPGEIYELDVEIWPTSIVLPQGYSLRLTVQGVDFARDNADGPLKGSGPFLHNDPQDRPSSVFEGRNTVITGPGIESYLLLPIVPQH